MLHVQGSTELRALAVRGVDRDIASKAEHYAQLVGLRCLLLDGYEVDGDFSGWSEELRWLQWKHCPHEELPRGLESPNLAVLDLAHSDRLTRVWARTFEPKVQIMNLILCKNWKSRSNAMPWPLEALNGGQIVGILSLMLIDVKSLLAQVVID
jgi:hypothetical protein